MTPRPEIVERAASWSVAEAKRRPLGKPGRPKSDRKPSNRRLKSYGETSSYLARRLTRDHLFARLDKVARGECREPGALRAAGGKTRAAPWAVSSWLADPGWGRRRFAWLSRRRRSTPDAVERVGEAAPREVWTGVARRRPGPEAPPLVSRRQRGGQAGEPNGV